MAIAFVSAGTGATTAANQGSLTYAADATGGSILVVGVMMGTGAGVATITGVTYNGVAMTQASQSPTSSVGVFGCSSLWYIDAPATGSNNIVVTASVAVNTIIESAWLTLSGTLTPSPEGAGGKTAQTAGGTAAESTSVTTGTDNSYIVATVSDDNWGSAYTPTAPNTNAAHFGEGTLSGLAIDLNYRSTTTAGAYTIAGSFSPGNAHSSVAMEIKPAAAAAATATFTPQLLTLKVG